MSKELEILERAKHDLSTLKDLKLEGHTATIFRTTGYDHLKEALELLEAKLTPPTADEVIEALKKDTKIDTWYYDEDLKVFWSSEDMDCEEVGEKYHTAYMENETRLMVCKFFKGEII